MAPCSNKRPFRDLPDVIRVPMTAISHCKAPGFAICMLKGAEAKHAKADT